MLCDTGTIVHKTISGYQNDSEIWQKYVSIHAFISGTQINSGSVVSSTANITSRQISSKFIEHPQSHWVPVNGGQQSTEAGVGVNFPLV